MPKKIFFISLLALAFFSASAQKITFNAVDFELKSEEKSKINRMASYEAKIFNGLYDNLINDSLQLTINLYSKYKNFKTVLEQHGMKGLTESGFYNRTTDQSYIYFKGTDNLQTVLHETSHALLKNNSEYYPKWFTEGLAEFLETLEEKHFNIQIVAQFDILERMKYDYQKKEAFNLIKFLGNNAAWRDKKQLNYMYTVSYCIIYYLYKQNPSFISKMAQMYKEGYPQEKIFTSLFGSISNFENSFKIYYR
jgi:hypothetical protein